MSMQALIDRVERRQRGWVWMLLHAAATLALGVVAIVFPLAVGLSVGWILGVTLVVAGVLQLVLGASWIRRSVVDVGSVAPALFALMQFDSPVPALIVFGVIQIAAAIIGNFVLPKMQADTQNIDPAISILALALWSTLWGIPGAFLAIPLTLALMYALAQSTRLRWVAVLMSNDGDPAPP